MGEHHQHEWLEQPVESVDLQSGEASVAWRFACRECVAVVAPCETCARPNETANRACRRCLDSARRVLIDIDAAAQVPFAADVLGVRAVRYDQSGGKGGRRVESLPFGLDAKLVDPDAVEELERRRAARPSASVIELMRAPANVLEPLHTWAIDWAGHLDTEPAGKVTDWLAAHLIWAANNPDVSDWSQYLEEATLVKRRLRRLVGLAPEIEDSPCVHCGGQVVRDWQGIAGLSDVRRCTGCETTWGDREHLDFANLTHLRALPRTRPDQLVTAEGARAAMPTSRRAQLRLVMHRDRKRIAEGKPARVPQRDVDERGRPLYRIADAWIAADPQVGVTAAEALAAVPEEHRSQLAYLLDLPAGLAPIPRGKLSDGTSVYALGLLAELAAAVLTEIRDGTGVVVRIDARSR